MLRRQYLLFTILVLFIPSLINTCDAQGNSPSTPSKFDPKTGDRIVFLGNSLFENDFQYGYLEYALTTRYNDRELTFRNLGWTGDNVWGEARSTYTNPPTPYQHLMQNITTAKPNIVFLAYGGVESQDGEAGIPHFNEGLNKLIDKIDSLGAISILLSPIPVVSTDTSINLSKRNHDIELYAAAIAKIAATRGKQYIDIYTPIWETSKKETIIEAGVHLNEVGYYYLANIIENGLGLKSEKETIGISVAKQAATASANAKVLESGTEKGGLTFEIKEKYLPLPLPKQNSWVASNVPVIRISGLKKGFYTLTADDTQIVTASAADWEKGIEIKQGPSYAQASLVRDMILKKNDLHFFQYRPMNETYIIGFRSYEQGRHVKGLEEQNILIKWLEGQIALNRSPRVHVYKLLAVSN